MNGYKILNFEVQNKHNGKLVAIENEKDFPFPIKRVYCIWGNEKSVIRGNHAHKKLKQVIICMSGSCDFILDNGKEEETVHLDTPSQGLYIEENIWRKFTNFSPNCIIMVLASEKYDENDYIRDYNTFLNSL